MAMRGWHKWRYPGRGPGYLVEACELRALMIVTSRIGER